MPKTISSSESLSSMLDIYLRIGRWTKWNELHISIVGRYLSNLSSTCNFPRLPSLRLFRSHSWWEWDPHMVASFKQEFKGVFVVPRLNRFHRTQNRITRFHLLEAFLSLLLQLLYHKPNPIFGPFKDRIENLEKELRYVLTILGDISWILLHSHDLEAQFQDVLPEFEAVANEAGSFVHYLFFSPDRTLQRKHEGVAAVLKLTDNLKANVESCVSIAAYATPTTSLLDSILILNVVVDEVEDLLKREDNPIPDLKDQANLLHQELLLTQSLIKDMRLQPQVKEALMRIGGIAHQAQYLITSFLVKDAPLWYAFNRLTHMIQPMRKEIQLLTQKHQGEEYNLRAEVSLHDKRSTEVDDITVGFEGRTTLILDQLVGGGTQSLLTISILGMPGLGKTTLAKNLFNHPLVKYTFDKLSWCVVSQTYKTRAIMANILIQINSEFGKDMILKMEEISLVEHIHKTLMGRRYLIVLDDVWDSSILDELLKCFQEDGNGSRILVTSRNKDVAPPNSIIHKLPFFSNEQCWELLEKKVFGTRTCPPYLQWIGRSIAARCSGLPLTVVVIAGILSTVDEEATTWTEVGKSLGSYIDGGEDKPVMQILELSYKHLPDRLKPCFLYFGEFEEDEEISVGNLKRLWVAEGFIGKEKDKSAKNIAGEYLMELIDKNLVMIAKKRMDGRGAKSCVVHDLLRDLCLKKCKEESFLKYLKRDCLTIYEKGHRLRAFGDSNTLSCCQHIRSFVGEGQSSSFYVRDMRLLRVLHFNRFLGRSPTFGIEYLVNLRYLVIQILPTWIDKLVNLEYLRVETGDMIVVYLPPAIGQMKKLRYLGAPCVEYSDDWNWNISNQINKLEYLSLVIIRKARDEELLKCSPHLCKLKCHYSPKGMDKSAYPCFDLHFLTQLDSLYLFGFLGNGYFRFPSNIRKLTLSQSNLLWEKMSIVGKLEFLEVLKLKYEAFVGKRWNTRDGEFQKLRFLQLEHMHLYEWNVASNDHFPRLQQLILDSCWNLQEIPSEIGEITTLELIEVKGFCLSSLRESAERIKEEQRDMGNEDLRVII